MAAAPEPTVAELHARYVDGINRRRPDLVGPLFAEDATWDAGVYGKQVGRAAIEHWLGELLVHWSTIFHTIDSAIVDYADDGVHAAGRLWFTESGILRGERRAMTGSFRDHYVLGADGRWRFAQRRFDITYRLVEGRHEAVSLPPDFDDPLMLADPPDRNG